MVCGTVSPKMVADHKDALVVEYYRSGNNNVTTQSSLAAVQPHCAKCLSWSTNFGQADSFSFRRFRLEGGGRQIAQC